MMVGNITAINGKVLTHASTSQVTRHRDCAAKWYQDKVEGWKAPTTASQEFGSEVHRIIESYLKYGTPIPDTKAGRAVKSALNILPQPFTPGMVCEGELTIDIGAALPFVIVIDVADWVSSRYGYIPRVQDHKTTSNAMYADTPDKLLTDWQINVYGFRALEVTGSNLVIGRKNYILSSKTPKAWAVENALPRDGVLQVVDQVRREVNALCQTALLPFNEVPKNYSSCDKFGGCHYRSRCLTATDMLSVIFDPRPSTKGKTVVPMSDQAFDLNAFLALNAPQGAPAPTPAPAMSFAPPPAFTPPPVPETPVTNPTDPITNRLVNELSENQIRGLAAQMLQGKSFTATVDMVRELRAGFAVDASGELLNQWIAWAKHVIPVQNAGINPPEQSIAPRADDVQKALEHGNGEKTRSQAKTPNEKALRKCIREIGSRNLRAMISSDGAPTITEDYATLKRSILDNVKDAYQFNEATNIAAAEYDARQLNAAAVLSWSNQGIAATTPIAPAAVPVPQKVLDAAQAQGVTLANPVANAPASLPPGVKGLLVTDMLEVQAFLKGLPDNALAEIYNNRVPATERFAAFKAGKAGTITKETVMHEISVAFGEHEINTLAKIKHYLMNGAPAVVTTPVAEAPIPNVGNPPAVVSGYAAVEGNLARPLPAQVDVPQATPHAHRVDVAGAPSAPKEGLNPLISEPLQGYRVLLDGCSRVAMSGAGDKADPGSVDVRKAYAGAFKAFRDAVALIPWPTSVEGKPLRLAFERHGVAGDILAIFENQADVVYHSFKS